MDNENYEDNINNQNDISNSNINVGYDKNDEININEDLNSSNLYTDELLDNEDFKRSRKQAIRKVLLSSIIYFFAFNLMGILFSSLYNITGLYMILVVGFAIIPIYFFIGINKLEKSLTFKKMNFTFKDFILFSGLMFIFTFLFSLLTNVLMDLFNISSIDVTAELSSSISFNLGLYVVLFGPFMEELQYRGFYLNHTRKYGALLSIILSGIIFSLAHMNFIQGIGTLGIGMILSYVAYFYSFRASLLLHVWNNLLVTLVALSLNDPYNPFSYSTNIIIFVGVIWILVISSVVILFKKKTRDKFKENLKLTKLEKEGLKALFTDPITLIYFVVAIAMTIVIGSAQI